MTNVERTQGERLRTLFRQAAHATIIAPFIKTDALRSLLDVIPARAPIRCVTRWLPTEVAAGVSDLEVLDVLEERGVHELLLADRLHAKLYIAGNHCLAGSANVTLSGLGETNDAGNIEILVDADLDDPAVAAVLRSIESDAIPATRAMADAVRRLAEVLPETPSLPFSAAWHPVSRHPEQAYRLYSAPPSGFLSAANRTLLADIARSNISPGLDERGFREAIRELLRAIPIAVTFLNSTEDEFLTRADVSPYLETVTTVHYGSQDLWAAFVHWMSYYYDDVVMRQEISEIALRRAQLLSRP